MNTTKWAKLIFSQTNQYLKDLSTAVNTNNVSLQMGLTLCVVAPIQGRLFVPRSMNPSLVILICSPLIDWTAIRNNHQLSSDGGPCPGSGANPGRHRVCTRPSRRQNQDMGSGRSPLAQGSTSQRASECQSNIIRLRWYVFKDSLPLSGAIARLDPSYSRP